MTHYVRIEHKGKKKISIPKETKRRWEYLGLVAMVQKKGPKDINLAEPGVVLPDPSPPAQHYTVPDIKRLWAKETFRFGLDTLKAGLADEAKLILLTLRFYRLRQKFYETL